MLIFFSFALQVDFTAKPTYWKPLYPPVKMKLGELLVSLTYLPAKNTLTIAILKAKNLKAKDINGKSGKKNICIHRFSRKIPIISRRKVLTASSTKDEKLKKLERSLLAVHTESLFSSISDPYVKVWLMFGDKRVEKKKTPIYKCNLNPIFNATFEFDVPWEQIRDCALDIQVMDFDTIGRNELIGRLLLARK